MLRSNRFRTILFTAALHVPAFALADDGVLGDWAGLKSATSEHGLELEAVVTNDLIGNVSGGLRRDTAFLQNYDFTATLDTEKAKLWDGGTAFFYLLGLTGEPPSALVGDLQVTDNIEAPESITVMEAWYEHSFDSFSLLVGLYDYNSEFNVTSLSDTLLNSSFGIGPDISQVGPSIFPVSSLSLRAKLNLSESSYLMGAI